MACRRVTAMASIAGVIAVAVALTPSAEAETADPLKRIAAARERPRGVVEDCSRISGVMSSREFESRSSLRVGPLALLRAAETLGYAQHVGGTSSSCSSGAATG